VTALYRYGAMAWIWRVVIAAALIGGGGVALLAVQSADPGLLIFTLILVAPALFFGAVFVVQVDRHADTSLAVQTLIFWRRRLDGARLRTPRLRQMAQADSRPIYAPRVWIPVRGSLPLYIDLLGTIADRGTFGATFGIAASALPPAAVS